MDLYAEPIPPTLVGKSLPHANFREVVLRRLTAVQEQKKSLNTTPLRLAPELWKSEKDILVEMLEKTQKLQLASQQAWAQERDDLERQIKRLESASRLQTDALKQDNDRLRLELDRLKLFEPDSEAEAALQDLRQRYKDREDQLTLQIRSLEATLVQYKEGLDKATEELEKKRFLVDEQTVQIEAKAEEIQGKLRKEVGMLQNALKEAENNTKKRKSGKNVAVQTEGRSEDSEKVEELKREMGGLKGRFEAEIANLKDEASRQVSSLRAQLAVYQTTPKSVIPEHELLPRIYDSLERLIALKQTQIPDLTSLIGIKELETWPELMTLHSQFKAVLSDISTKCRDLKALNDMKSSENQAKICIELYTSSLKALLEVARELRPGSDSALLQVDNDRLRKERDTLITAVQSLKTRSNALETLLEVFQMIDNRLETQESSLKRMEEIFKQLNFKCLSALTALEISNEENKERSEDVNAMEMEVIRQLQGLGQAGEEEKKQIVALQQQKGRLEEALARLKQLYDSEMEELGQQYADYQLLVAAERSRLSDHLEKIAESVEYRQEIWEQFQAPNDEENLQQVQTLAQELERQTQWELSTLAALLTRLRTPLQKEPPADINEIKEEEEEDDEEDEDGTPDAVVVKLR